MERLQLMLQKLLADRFHLEMHKENRPSLACEVTIAQTGLKMKPAQAPTTPTPSSRDAPPAPATGMQWSSGGEKIELRGRGVTIRQLLIWLNEENHCDMVDKTGLAGAYDFDMTWIPEPSAEPSEPSASYALLAAVEKYLGLKIAEHKVAVETLVLDRLDRVPVEN
jgi:uncharacterized protein (TIGR03435 family)